MSDPTGSVQNSLPYFQCRHNYVQGMKQMDNIDFTHIGPPEFEDEGLGGASNGGSGGPGGASNGLGPDTEGGAGPSGQAGPWLNSSRARKPLSAVQVNLTSRNRLVEDS